MSVHRIFDRAALRRRRDRAAPDLDAHGFLFRRVAADVAERLTGINRRFRRALDLGGRTGLFGAAWRPDAEPELLVTADLSPAMAARAPRPSLVCDEERLPFGDGTFDLAVSVLSLHAVNDLPGALIQIRRALRPDGLFIGAFYGPGTLAELRAALLEAETELDGGASPRIAPFADIRDLGQVMQRAGLALPVCDADRITVRYDGALHLMRDLRGMGESNVLAERRRTPLRRTTLMRAADLYGARHSRADGRVQASFEIIYVTGWAPHESQQKPLAPRGARIRPADVPDIKDVDEFD